MNPAQSGPTDDDDHCCDTTLNLSAAKLDVYKYERLAYTESPMKNSASRPLPRRMPALLKAICNWFRVRF